ncbi:hypothetical protein COLO4_05654 [Corchorus olitorius]|uniref:Uncharacterized protein n=1 Tax=Corchorus olitorius TaxID=93759 RepID=A0A1R3KQA7_9ROSI|nr:hypothetical protein COLO4_05654 [Corchorus olitorius]
MESRGERVSAMYSRLVCLQRRDPTEGIEEFWRKGSNYSL